MIFYVQHTFSLCLQFTDVPEERTASIFRVKVYYLVICLDYSSALEAPRSPLISSPTQRHNTEAVSFRIHRYDNLQIQNILTCFNFFFRYQAKAP
jgi:hypothetical protein